MGRDEVQFAEARAADPSFAVHTHCLAQVRHSFEWLLLPPKTQV